jgi:TonB-linked SusC/RagA family outer membrane protein
MRKFTLLLVLLLFGGIQAVLAQRTISGVITSSQDGSAIPGVTILVKEATRVGTLSDLNGKYSLKVPANAKTLRFTFIGMKMKEVALTSNNTLNVSLDPDVTQLEGVVVTALGVSREKKSLGYSVQDVKSDKLEQASNPNLMTALQGKLAGVEIKPSSGMPGASSQIIIRGARSFTGNNTPLYVVDGMPINSSSDYSTGDGVTGSDLSNRAIDIDPSEIESINVLKGQAASALYGVRASNGVIVITTKSGKGLAVGKPVISINSSFSMDQISRLPDLQTTWAQGLNGAFNPSASTSWGPKIVDLPNDPTYGGNVANKYNNQDPSTTKGKYYVPELAKAGLNPWVTPTIYNNGKDFFELGHTSSTSANVSQNTGNASYSFGLGNTTQQGIISSTDLNRYTAKASAEVKLNDQWITGFSMNYSESAINKASGANDGILATVFPAPPSYNLKGIPDHITGDPYTQINYRSLTFDNPYWAKDNNKFTEKTNRFFGNSFIEFNPKIAGWSKDKKLNFKYQFGTDFYSSNYEDLFGYGHKGSDGTVSDYGLTTISYNSLFTANYQMDINKDLKFTAILGNEINQTQEKDYSMYGQHFNFGGWSNIANTSVQQTNDNVSKSRNVGFFGSLSLSYQSMLYLNVTGRNDIASVMPRNNRSFFYPSTSLGFVFTELEALKNNDILSFGKIRGSYAEVGQTARYYNNYYASPNYAGDFWAASPITYPVGGVNSYRANSTIYDPNLKPQNTISYEIGTELHFFKNLINIDYTYSRQNVKDQIFPVPLAGSTGEAYLEMNAGKVHTNAHELSVTINPIHTKDIEWSIGGNFTKIDNYVDELASGVQSIFLGGFVTPQVRAAIGEKFPVIYGSSYKRDSKGRILVDEVKTDPGYGMPMKGDNAIIGRVSPDFTVGFNTSFRYKYLTLSATVDWKSGGQMYSGSNGLYNNYGVSKTTADRTTPFVFKGYKADGTPNDISRGGTNDPNAYQELYSTLEGGIDEAYIYNSSFVKLREIALAYQLPKFNGLQFNVSVFARNILLWSELPNVDPESSQGNTNMGGSFERFSVPQTSSFGMSLSLTF